VDGGAGDLDGEVAQLWREQRALAAELESLRASSQPESSSIIYVGHADGIDLVLDLDLVAGTSAKRRSSP
jgi:hypothetical protein